jgi:hypothetical protein
MIPNCPSQSRDCDRNRKNAVPRDGGLRIHRGEAKMMVEVADSASQSPLIRIVHDNRNAIGAATRDCYDRMAAQDITTFVIDKDQIPTESGGRDDGSHFAKNRMHVKARIPTQPRRDLRKPYGVIFKGDNLFDRGEHGAIEK